MVKNKYYCININQYSFSSPYDYFYGLLIFKVMGKFNN